MATPPLFSGLDGLMTLSRREGVDIRPTLLRVLTDLYVQAATHTDDEERQYIELASRLIDGVDDATRAVVRARLAIYPRTPAIIAEKLGLVTPQAAPDAVPAGDAPVSAAGAEASRNTPSQSSSLVMLPSDAAELSEMFFSAGSRERAAMLLHLADAPLKGAPHISLTRATHALETLEKAALASDVEAFTIELAESLILPAKVAARVVNDPGGEPLACALKALEMPGETYQRILLFLNTETGSSVNTVYRLARLYDRLSEHAALVLLAAWRSAAVSSGRGRHRPLLHDDERHRARGGQMHARHEHQPAAGEGAARPLPRRTTND